MVATYAATERHSLTNKNLPAEEEPSGDGVPANARLKDDTKEQITVKNDDDEEDDGDDSDNDEDIGEIKRHPSYEQVLLDVNRCAGRLEHIRQCYFHRTADDEPPEDLTEELELQRIADDCGEEKLCGPIRDEEKQDNGESEKLQRIARDLKYQRKLKRKLAKLILRLLIKKPDLHYYQGFHDVCLTYMTIHGAQTALNKLDSLIDTHFNAFMQPTMKETQEFLELIPIIVGLQDSVVQDFMERAEVGTIFALSWVITWFSHVIPNERDVETIYGHLEKTNNPHLVLYLCAAIVLYKRDHLLELEPEMSTVHKFLCQVPRKEKLPINDLLREASRVFQRWPPEYLKRRLDEQRMSKLQVHNYSVFSRLAQRIAPNLTSMVAANSRTAIIVLVVASALALQFDRWIR